MRQLALLALAGSLMPGPSALAADCPALLGEALRLVLVTAPAMDRPVARLQLFTRAAPQATWERASEPMRAVVGAAGLAWGYTFHAYRREGEAEKVEGDKRTPAGVFRLGPSFGFARSDLPGYILVEAGETVCVEDASSPFYNRIARRSEVGLAANLEDMRRSRLFRRGLFVDYPTDRAGRRGSCIFVHIWQGPAKGTAGCIGLPEDRVASLQQFARPGAVVAVLPEPALDRFAGCLPDASPRAPR